MQKIYLDISPSMYILVTCCKNYDVNLCITLMYVTYALPQVVIWCNKRHVPYMCTMTATAMERVAKIRGGTTRPQEAFIWFVRVRVILYYCTFPGSVEFHIVWIDNTPNTTEYGGAPGHRASWFRFLPCCDRVDCSDWMTTTTTSFNDIQQHPDVQCHKYFIEMQTGLHLMCMRLI